MPASLAHVAALASTLPVSPLDSSELDVESCLSPTFAIEARLVSHSVEAIMVSHVPTRVQADRPLEVGLACVGSHPDAEAYGSASARIVGRLYFNACLCVCFGTTQGHHLGSISARVSVQLSGGGWVARALIHPAIWANAASITVVSFTLAGRPLPCDCLLPATLQIGYNHAPSPKGAVLVAAIAGDVLALQAALDAGGSTEEVDNVCGGRVPT